MRPFPFPLVSCAALLSACASTSLALYADLGGSTLRVTTRSEQAQRWFDQGLLLSWGFSHEEAVASFEEAARLDPECAMAFWGIAYALGPNINHALTDAAAAARAYRMAQQAQTLADKTSDVERALISAMVERYADPPPSNRKQLDAAYAAAMRGVWQRFPGDPDVGALFADALMNVSQDWRAWGTDQQRGPDTPEMIATLEQVLATCPEHIGANHFYIHAVEASDRPERALASADRLGSLAPAAGHLVHMPTHIYIRLGLYQRAVETNARAIAADDAFFAQAGPQGVYQMYRAHNHHFLAWAAMFQGSREPALDAARRMVAKLPANLDALPVSLESFLFVPIHVMMRFGMWEQVLAEPAPAAKYAIATALWHHARAVAYANTGRIEEARAEAEHFEQVAAAIPATKTVRRAKVETLMAAARGMMNGEIRFKQGRYDEAFAALRAGIAAEDSMPYSEPPGWMQPIRHSLGALLLEAGRVAEAEGVYRADLAHHAENVWSLHGLGECLRRLGRNDEAAAVAQRLAEASRHADVAITASCYCRTESRSADAALAPDK